jgi:ABC-type amino acid transport substrate-binding protein
VCTLLTLLLVKRRMKLRPANLGALALVTVLGVPAVLTGLAIVFDRAIGYEYRGYEEFVDRESIYRNVRISQVDYDPDAPAADPAPPRMDRIKASRELRIGYSADALPWAFRNSAGALVGYDIELLRRLALDFELDIKAVRLPLEQVPHALASSQIDIYASGLLLEPRRERAFAVSEPYIEISLGLLVRDHERRAIEARGRFIGDESEKIGVLNAPSIRRAIEIRAPGIRTEPVASPREFLRGNRPDLTYLVMPAESAAAWAMVYPDFSVVVPSSRKIRIPMVFALPAGDSDWAEFIDQWITTSQSVGITDTAYRYWILGESIKDTRKRWSVIRDVLGWVE